MGQNSDSLTPFALLRVAYTEKQVIENVYSSKVIAIECTSGKYVKLNDS